VAGAHANRMLTKSWTVLRLPILAQSGWGGRCRRTAEAE
jgi:hypothetical protein